MDNVTHSLAGLAIGVALTKDGTDRVLRRAVISASILANNIPDADIFYASFISRPFGYLLHHRGHTHTVWGALGCGVLAWLIILGLWALWGRKLTQKESRMVFLTTVLGAIAHLLLDATNTYGVHPFWPISNRWIYGDTLFIIEPTLWIALAFAVAACLHSRIGKTFALAPAVAGACLIIFSGMVPQPVIAVLAAFFIAGFLVARRFTPTGKLQLWTGVACSIVLIFAVSGALARVRWNESFTESTPVLVSFVQPSPSNPLCWTAWRMSREKERFIYEREVIDLSPRFLPLDCKRYVFSGQSHGAIPVSSYVTRLERITLPHEALTALSDNCRWKAFLQFARVPSVIECETSGTCTTDLRFSRRSTRNFSSQPLEGDCPSYLPPWDPPIGDALSRS